MSFRDNLQHLRATHSMTQEQLALMLGVSRQSVTKWEAERAYPEMDKLLKLCQIFDCTLDDLVQGDLTATSPTPRGQAVAAALRESAAAPPQDVCGYDEHMRAFARKIATGVAAILLGVSLLIFTGTAAERFDPSLEALGLIPLFAGIVIGVGLILSGSFQHTEFQRSHPYIQDFYSEGDRRAAQRSLTASIVIGISLIFIGVVASIPADGHGDFAEGIAGGFLVALVAAAAWLIIRSGMLLARLNVANYNASREQALAESDTWKYVREASAAELRGVYTDEQICEILGIPDASDVEIARARARLERRHRKSQLSGGLCGIIMILATVAGIVMLLVPGYQTPYFWMAWVIGGLLCGVASIFVSTFVRDDPAA
ncbi:helix-turn-helix transcriptional regulator [Adlercreutzia faecimuris]|uniref:Helix-turn-helix transcriptional regulator n=1 Tax=Adlercreutzia faecimuris TaxID=2897341 RepID=A0ABS9WE46_9ACTN|nr:helix-turn-helix transcriptional regulator [Adlercreutzia sp. JBNU-10]MCI2241144.1 helix-turn-helix transcriptional regulator [Adlercreutzia sp. JBNU-10]